MTCRNGYKLVQNRAYKILKMKQTLWIYWKRIRSIRWQNCNWNI